MPWFQRMLMGLLLLLSTGANATEVDLYDMSGRAVAYIDGDQSLTIFTWQGQPAAYLVEGCGQACMYVYNRQGRHIGFIEQGVMFDLVGEAVGSVYGGLNMIYHAPPSKGTQRQANVRLFRSAPRSKPIFSNQISEWDLYAFLTQAG